MPSVPTAAARITVRVAGVGVTGYFRRSFPRALLVGFTVFTTLAQKRHG